MARLPGSGPVEAEPLAPAMAEEWFDADDVRALLAAGHDGQALLDHLSVIAGDRYRRALRDQPRTPQSVPRGDVLTTRPEPGEPYEAVDSWRSWLFTGRCDFRDPEGFLSEVSELV